MSTKGLATTALVLAGLLSVLGVAGAHRLGYFAPAERLEWEFTNFLCDCEPGTMVHLRPGMASDNRMRYWFLRSILEPEADDLAASDSEVGRFAHFRTSIEIQPPHEEGWYFDGAGFFAYRQLGALTHKEFLHEIKLVTEDDGAGKRRNLLRAEFQTATRAKSMYYYDPSRDPAEARKSGWGWERVERHAKGTQSEVAYLSAFGFKEPPPLKKRPESPDDGK
ncbi:MAG: hypothetical protein ACYTHK_02640 [Planctomycetota bacterium]|jgi:hypothetical protein